MKVKMIHEEIEVEKIIFMKWIYGQLSLIGNEIVSSCWGSKNYRCK